MALTVSHPFHNPKSDGADTTIVRPSDWNASHALSGQVAFSELSGNIAVGQMASGSGASVSTFWRGDGTWATPAGGGGTPGGANTNVQFNSSSAFGGDSGFTYAGSGQATLAFGAVTANAKALNITGTWNNSGVAFDAPLFINITNTASAAGSALADFQVGSASVLKIVGNNAGGSQGVLNFGSPGVNVNILHLTDPGGSDCTLTCGTNRGFALAGTNSLSRVGIGTDFDGTTNCSVLYLETGGLGKGAGMIGWGSGALNGTAPDLYFGRDAANTTAQRNGTNAQTIRVYNTYTDASNYERGAFDWTTTPNTLTIGSQAAGTGAHRNVNISAYGNHSISIAADSPTTVLTNTSYDLHEFSLKASGGTSGSVRYEHRAGSMVHSANNALGELQVGPAATNYVQGLWSPNTITIGGGVAGSFQPFIYPDYRVSRTANLTLVGTTTTSSPTTDTGTSYDNNGAVGEVDFTLPTAGGANAPPGTKYDFYVAAAQILKIIAHAGDTIRIAGSVSTSGGNASASTIGNYLEIEVMAANKWAAKATQGTWTLA